MNLTDTSPVPTPFPVYHKFKRSTYQVSSGYAYPPPSNYQQYVSPPQQYQPRQDYHPPKVNFDDAPEIIYGIAIRLRRDNDCMDSRQECEQLELDGKVFECNISRFRLVNLIIKCSL